MNWHVQQRTLPAPGSDAQLDELIAELHAPMLERDRPGWRAYVIDGLARNRFAVFIKIHHALVDGESGIALVHSSLARSPQDRRIRTVVSTSLPGHPRRPRDAAAATRARAVAGRAPGAVDWMGIGNACSRKAWRDCVGTRTSRSADSPHP